MSIVFDTEPLLIFYKGEAGQTKVRDLLIRVNEGKLKAYINIVNLTEFYYILHRYSPQIAEEKTRTLKAFGINIIPLTDNTLWRLAAENKSQKPMSLADSFAVATAKTMGSTLVIGRDTEFDGIDIDTLKI